MTTTDNEKALEALQGVREALAFYADKDISVNSIYNEGGKQAVKSLAILDAVLAEGES